MLASVRCADDIGAFYHMHDLRHFIDAVESIIARHELTSGQYARWTHPGKDHAANPYGCADAANLLYTIGRFPGDAAERAAWVQALQAMQASDSGLWHESTHHTIHTTAHCIAALELFDALPRHPLNDLQGVREPNALRQFLDQLAWKDGPWGASHEGAGLFAALMIAGDADEAFTSAYFEWLWNEADPDTGFWRRGNIGPVASHGNSVFPHLAGSFHYLFNLEAARQPLRYPEAMIDTCLQLRETNDYPSLGQSVAFAEIDWVYCLTRARRQCGHRFAECQQALEDFAAGYIEQLLARDPETDERLDDLHALFGALCCLAELQSALPGQIKTERPLKLVLDRRPFI